MSTSTAVLHGWHHDNAEDAAKEIWAAVGDLSGVELFGTQILIGVYVRPVKTRGGILTPQTAQKEDVWQGPVGMILKIGPEAFPRDEKARADLARDYGGRLPEPGDWVFSRVADAYQLSIKGAGGAMPTDRQSSGWGNDGWPCRLLYLADLYGRVALPQIVV